MKKKKDVKRVRVETKARFPLSSIRFVVLSNNKATTKQNQY